MNQPGQTPLAPPQPPLLHWSVCLIALWNPHRPEIQTTNSQTDPVRIHKVKRSINQATWVILVLSWCHTCRISCCLWRPCSSVASLCVRDRKSDWIAAEEEASTWLFSWSPKVCSCCRDWCTEAWLLRHVCNSQRGEGWGHNHRVFWLSRSYGRSLNAVTAYSMHKT